MATGTLIMFSPVVLIVLAFSLIGLCNIILTALRSPLKNIPGPLYTRFTRLPLKLAILGGRRMDYIHDLHLKYGPIVQIAPAEISFADVEAHKTIHNARLGYTKSHWYQDFNDMPSPGIFVMRNLNDHAVRRRLLSRPFAKSSLRTNMELSVKELIATVVTKIKAEMQQNGKVDILKWWFLMAADASGQIMFGNDFGMVAAGKETEYIKRLTTQVIGMGIGVELPWLRDLGSRLPFQACKILWPSHATSIENGRAALANVEKHSGGAPVHVFDAMVELAEKGTPALTQDEACIEASNLIIAATDTTAITLTYLIWAVLQQPQLQRSLEAEVQALTPEQLTDESLEALPLLNAVIQETLRLYGAAPSSLPRTVPAGGAQLCGHALPGGIEVSTQAYTLHRLPKIWGPDAEVFRPDRWLGAEKTQSENAVFAPWGAGSRICLGLHMALMELRLATAMFFRDIAGAKIAPDTTPSDMAMENYFLISPKAHKCFITQ